MKEKSDSYKEEEPYPEERRSHHDRRAKKSPGFTYMSMVGWMCQRERSRRRYDRKNR